MAEEVGFEPTELSFNGFQDRRLQPLGHSSVLKLFPALSGNKIGEYSMYFFNSQSLFDTLFELFQYFFTLHIIPHKADSF